MSPTKMCEHDANFSKADWVRCWCTKIKDGKTFMIAEDKYLDRCPKLKVVKDGK